MIPLLIRSWPLAAALIAAMALWAHGYQTGKYACEARAVIAENTALREARQMAETAIRKETERLQAEAVRDMNARQAEDKAREEASRYPDCLSADRVRRLGNQ